MLPNHLVSVEGGFVSLFTIFLWLKAIFLCDMYERWIRVL